MRSMFFFVLTLTCAICGSAEGQATYLLETKCKEGDSWIASVDLQVGGDQIIPELSGDKKFPLSVSAQLKYEEQLLAWSGDEVARSLRYYDTVAVKIQKEGGGTECYLRADSKLVVAEIRNQRAAFNGSEKPMSRQQLDLVNVVGNTLALQRLLPGRNLAEGDSWDHTAAAIGPLLGLDYVAVCEVSSVVTGEKHDQVQIRLVGTVHGTVDGAPTEMELRGAYLFHQRQKRITKFNLAIKELRTASEIVPGLDIVAKVSITLEPVSKRSKMTASQIKQASNLSDPLERELVYDARTQGFRFKHDVNWYVTGEQRELVSLRCMHRGDLVAHCNISTLPARSEGRFTSLDQFERDVRTSLGDSLESVAAATNWTTPQGYECLGVVAKGKVEDVPIEWRYYLIAADGLPRVSLAVTVEQSQLEQFKDGDRQLVDSLELMPAENETATIKKNKSVSR